MKSLPPLRHVLFALSLTLLAACGGFRLRPVAPEYSPADVRPIGSVVVTLADSMDEKQRRICEKYGVAPEMERVLYESLGATGSPEHAYASVVITSIRHSAVGPSRMHTETVVVAPDGAIIKELSHDSTSMQSKAIRRVAQDIVRKVANDI
jgi:hypothetical protein